MQDSANSRNQQMPPLTKTPDLGQPSGGEQQQSGLGSTQNVRLRQPRPMMPSCGRPQYITGVSEFCGENPDVCTDENEALTKTSIIQYDRDTILRIGHNLSRSDTYRVHIPIADCIKIGMRKRNQQSDNTFNQNPRTHGIVQNQQLGQMHSEALVPPLTQQVEPTIVKIVKNTHGIINRVTPNNFGEWRDKFLKMELNDQEDLISAVIEVIFEKIVEEPRYSAIYTQLISHACQTAETAKNFRKEILDQCRHEFERSNNDETTATRKQKEIDNAPEDKKQALSLDLEDFRVNMRRRSHGNIRFIGELFKLQMLTPKTIVKYVDMLLSNQNEGNYDCLCELLTAVGRKLDNDIKLVEDRVRLNKSRCVAALTWITEENYMDNTFQKLRQLSNDPKLSSRIRCALLDLVVLRENKWIRNGNSPKERPEDVKEDTICGLTPPLSALSKVPVSTPACNRLNTNPSAEKLSHKSGRKGAATPEEKQPEAILKQTREILDKLTLDNFEMLGDKFLELDLDGRQDRISAVTEVIFEKAINEPAYSAVYAQLVGHVCQTVETSKRFRKEVLDQCQRQFQRINNDEIIVVEKINEIRKIVQGDEKEALKLELKDFRKKLRQRSLGSVRFIGELFKIQMLTSKIMVDFVRMLLANQDEESYECLCVLLTTVGRKLEYELISLADRVKNAKSRGIAPPENYFIPEKNYMKKTFTKLEQLSNDNQLSPRVRLAFRDLMKLRENKWVPRRGTEYSQNN